MAETPMMTASGARLAMAAGRLTPSDWMELYLARAKERDADVGAWAYLDEDQAMAAAKAADDMPADASKPLLGIPVALKDIIDTKDMPTENGSALFKGRRPATDSTMVHLLREAGAIIMGKAVTTEFALSAAGKTKNPHDPARTPGGSSSGSAAAVADGQVALAIGSQTGGSAIRPASFCGCYGYKPTYGTISRAGMFTLSRVLDHPGLYARSLEDLALFGDVLTKKDPADLDMRPHLKPELSDAMSEGTRTTAPKIAFVKGPAWEQAAEPYMDALFDGLIAKLGDAVQFVEMAGIFDEALPCHSTVMYGSLDANIGDYCRDHGELVRDETKRRHAEGEGVTAAKYIKAIEFRDTLRGAVNKLFDHYDVIITAAAPGEAPLGLESTGNAIFQKIWTLTGVPTLTLPKLTGPNGMPVGVQVIGRYGHDADLFRNAQWLDKAL